MNSDDRFAFDHLDKRIRALEHRLKNAKHSRDAYIDFLRSKYPLWKPGALPTYETPKGPNNHDLVNELATSEYHWDGGHERPYPRAQIGPGTLYNQIPSRGPLLDSDVVLMRQRLKEISEQLRVMREHRMPMPTEDYVRLRAAVPVDDGLVPSISTDAITDIRRRLNDIQISAPQRPLTPTNDQIMQQEYELEQEKLMNDIRNGHIGVKREAIPIKEVLQQPAAQQQISQQTQPTTQVYASSQQMSDAQVPLQQELKQDTVAPVASTAQRRVVFGDHPAGPPPKQQKDETSKQEVVVEQEAQQESKTMNREARPSLLQSNVDFLTECPKSAKIDPDNCTWTNCLPGNNSTATTSKQKEKKQASDYQKMMALLGSKDDASDSSDTDTTNDKPFGNLLGTKSAFSGSDLLSSYLKGSSTAKNTKKESQDSIDRLVMGGGAKDVESDSDFFG